jgi:hypothetical protein
MANSNSLSNIRCDRKVSQLANEAEQDSNETRMSWKPILMPAFVLAFVGLLAALAGIGSPVAADMSGFDLNLTWVGTMFSNLFNAGAAVAPGFQSFIEAWFGPVIEAVVLFAVVAVIVMVFVVGPAKVIETLEKFISKIL